MQRNTERERPSDNPQLNANQTMQEQVETLANMRYSYSLFGWEGGPLVDYRRVVEDGSDTIPGRTQDESLEMIERATRFIIRFERGKRTRAARSRLIRVAVITLVLAGAVVLAVWVFPHLADLGLN